MCPYRTNFVMTARSMWVGHFDNHKSSVKKVSLPKYKYTILLDAIELTMLSTTLQYFAEMKAVVLFCGSSVSILLVFSPFCSRSIELEVFNYKEV